MGFEAAVTQLDPGLGFLRIPVIICIVIISYAFRLLKVALRVSFDIFMLPYSLTNAFIIYVHESFGQNKMLIFIVF